MNSKRGFTLIELLVVIAIIGLLSSVVLASLNSARTKAKDAKMQSDLHNLRTAINLYYSQYGTYPPNVNSTNHDIQINLQPLVTSGLMSSLPVSANGYPYQYYNYGPGNDVGAIVVGYAAGNPPATTAGYPGTCRPFGVNWCSNLSINNYYCLCNPY